MRQHLRSEIVKLPRVHRIRKKGRVYKYHKVTRASLPNDVPEDHESFVSAWAIEEAKKSSEKQRAPTGSIADGVARYYRSPQYKALSREYAATIRRNAQAIYHTYGDAPADRLKPDHINLDLGKLHGNQRVERRKTWRQLGLFWKECGYTMRNVADGVMEVRAPKGPGHRPWSVEQIEIYRASYPIGTVPRLCFELLYWTGARTVDAVTLGPRLVDHKGLLVLSQSKTKHPAYVPWTSILPSWALSMEGDRQMLMACLPRAVFTYLETAQNKPRSKKGLSNVIAEAARDAGIHGRSAHGLRKSRLIHLAELGASVHVIMAWGGHKTLSEAQEYITDANRTKELIGTERDQNTLNRADQSGKLQIK